MLLHQEPQRVGEKADRRPDQTGYTEQNLIPRKWILKWAFLSGQHSLAHIRLTRPITATIAQVFFTPLVGALADQGILFWLLCTCTLSSWLLIKCFESSLGFPCNALSSWPGLAALKSPRQCCCGWWCRTVVLSHPTESLEESSPAFCVVPFVRPFHQTTHWCRAGQNVLLPFCHFMLISPRIRMQTVDKMQGTGRNVFNDCKNLPLPPVFN